MNIQHAKLLHQLHNLLNKAFYAVNIQTFFVTNNVAADNGELAQNLHATLLEAVAISEKLKPAKKKKESPIIAQ